MLRLNTNRFQEGLQLIGRELLVRRSSMDSLKAALHADEDFAWSFCCEMRDAQYKTMASVGYTDCEGVEKTCLATSVNFMSNMFGLDITTNKHFVAARSRR